MVKKLVPPDPQSPNLSIPEALALALSHHRAGRLREAETIYRKILAVNPRHPDALHLLGVIAHQVGKEETALDLIGKALAIDPDRTEFLNNAGEVLRALNRPEEATAYFERALSLNPDLWAALNNLGVMAEQQGAIERARVCYERALSANPDYPEAHHNLANVLRASGSIQEAIIHYEAAIAARPGYVEALNDLGNIYGEQGRLDKADSLYREALRINPAYAEAHCNLANVLHDRGNLEGAVSHYKQALACKPSLVEAHICLANTLYGQGLTEDARSRYDSALSLDPHHPGARLGRCIARIPVMYRDRDEISRSREQYGAELRKLSRTLALASPAEIEKASRAVGGIQPYFLPYQEENDRELQSLYGDLVCRIQGARYPAFAERPPMPSSVPGEPLRVGIVSGFFCYHSNWKMRIRGWLEKLDRRRFSVYGYYTGHRKDRETALARDLCGRFVEGPPPFGDLCRIIREDRLHLLLYPELGMDPMAIRLAALRLAPVQAVSWSHPVTSGLPTIDYFLSNELMEPEDGDDHYREELVRLPRIGVCYLPLDIAPATVDRRYFGLPEDTVIYLCAQAPFKYLPHYDEVFPRIAREVGACRFVFLAHPRLDRSVAGLFSGRLEAAFASFSLRAADYVTILPYQDAARYQALNSVADVFLDTIGWNGCNTTLEALARDLPVVTLPGRLMRGRHSLAILTMMGITDTVASSMDDYVDLAVRLGRDTSLRREASGHIAANKHRLYGDMESIRALEAFIEGVAARY